MADQKSLTNELQEAKMDLVKIKDISKKQKELLAQMLELANVLGEESLINEIDKTNILSNLTQDAIENNDLELFKFIIEDGVDAKWIFGHVMFQNNPEMVRIMIDHNQINRANLRWLMNSACQNGNNAVIRLLFDTGCPIDHIQLSALIKRKYELALC